MQTLKADPTTVELVYMVLAGWSEQDALRLTRAQRHARLELHADIWTKRTSGEPR